MAASWKAVPSIPLLQCLVMLLILTLFQTCEGVPGIRRKRQFSDLLYTSVCEGSTMDLRCQSGNVIYIEYANFGRVDNVTCTSGPVLTTECYSSNAQDIVANVCNGKSSCSIPTTVAYFGDDCPGTVKYLEVLFKCVTAPTTTVPPTTTTIPTTTVATTKPKPVATDLPGDVTTIFPDVATTTATTTTTKAPPTTRRTTTTHTTTVVRTTRKPLFCMPRIERGVQWEHAPAGTTDVQPCPPEHVGVARWMCSDTGQWTPESGPDLSDCISEQLVNITEQLEHGASVSVISEDLAVAVDEVTLVGGDILAATNILTSSLGGLDKELENATAEEKTQKTKEVTKNYLKVGSTILEDKNLESWSDLSNETQTETASTLITTLEDSAFLLADTLGDDETVVQEEDNVVMEVIVRGQDDDSDLIFPNSDQLSDNWRGITDSITLPADTIRERTKDGKTKIVLLAYNNIGQFLGIKNGTMSNRPTKAPTPLKQESQPPCSKEKRNVTDLGDKVNSRVLSVSINDPRESRPLLSPVNLTFEHTGTNTLEDNYSDPVCSFWKFDNTSGEFRTGEWSDGGCVMVHNNETHTICSCDHLTNFAIIMNVKNIEISKSHAFALSFITYFGFVISIPCLILALATFCWFKNLQSDRTTIHKNLCFSLLLAELIFAAGISQTGNKTLCAVIALLLHYFFLSAFAWMCLEGIQLYIMLVEVFEAESSRRKYYYPFGYILPLIIVGISASVDFWSYGTPEYCWLCAESSFVWAFIGPVCLIIFGNILFLSMALFIMCQHSSLQTNPKEKTPKEKATSLVRGALVLLCLLGVTWAFGLLHVSESSIVFAYIFTITNSVQGLFIFIFHCCMNDKVCKEYRRYVRNSTWLPECIREQYGGTFLTNSNQQNSYRSSSAAKRPDSKRFSNTTGSYSVDNRKMSNSSVYRNSGQYEHVKFNSEMSVPEEENVDFGVARVIADEGIGLDFEENPVHESTRIDAAEGNETQDNVSKDRLSVNTTEFEPLILNLAVDTEKQAKIIHVNPPPEEPEQSPLEMRPFIRESGIGGSRSGSSCSEDFAPASPLSQDVPNKAHVFANSGTCGMTGSMPDLINPLTAHACKARMDLVPVAFNNANNVADVAATDGLHARYNTLPHTTTPAKKSDLPPKGDYQRSHSNADFKPSPWHKRASRMDDIDVADKPEKEVILLSTSTPPSSPRVNSPLETVI